MGERQEFAERQYIDEYVAGGVKSLAASHKKPAPKLHTAAAG